MKTKTDSGCGTTFTVGFMQLIFLILSATDTVNWPWWAVWSPALAGIGLTILLFVAVFIVFVVAELTD